MDHQISDSDSDTTEYTTAESSVGDPEYELQYEVENGSIEPYRFEPIAVARTESDAASSTEEAEDDDISRVGHVEW